MCVKEGEPGNVISLHFQKTFKQLLSQRLITKQGHPGGPDVKILPSTEGGTGSVPGWELRCHVLHAQNTKTCKQKLILWQIQ